jgi:hypothetical protein
MFQRPLDVLGFLLIVLAALAASVGIDHCLREPYAFLTAIPVCFSIGFFGSALWLRLTK